jgi:hypothetical protein
MLARLYKKLYVPADRLTILDGASEVAAHAGLDRLRGTRSTSS